MKPRLLFVIDSNPRQSGRAAEGIRIAAGIGAWKKVDVDVFLREKAEVILGDDAENLVDGDHLAEHVKLIRAAGGAVRTGRDTTENQLAQMATAATTLLRF